jgi:hypothetical protein
MIRSRATDVAVLAAGSALVLASLATASDALADDSRGARRAVAARERGLAYTMVEANVGIYALPAATVCPTSLDQCETGEVSIALGLANSYQIGPYGFGALINWATTLRDDAARGAPQLEREHSRRYFLVETFFRYLVVQKKKYEFWVAGFLGGVGVSDSWTVKLDRDPIGTVQFVGPRSSTIGTLGVAFGPGVGGSYILIDNFSVGGVFTYENWILPFEPKTSPTGDVASLSGRLDVFHLGLSAAYRLPL